MLRNPTITLVLMEAMMHFTIADDHVSTMELLLLDQKTKYTIII